MPSTKSPNILWICSDQQRYDTLGCYGNSFVTTPNIDHLAQEGVLFEQAFSQSPVCTPSRAAFLTGRYPRTTRDRQNGQSVPADEQLITRFLADQGYQCGLSGKLHLSVCNPSTGHDMEPRIADGYSEFHWSHHPAPDWPANEYNQWLAEKGITFHTPNRPDCQYVQAGMPAEHHQTTWCVEKAVDFIRARTHGDNPWLFSINIYDPHHAFDPAPEYLEPYLKNLDQIPLPNYHPGKNLTCLSASIPTFSGLFLSLNLDQFSGGRSDLANRFSTGHRPPFQTGIYRPPVQADRESDAAKFNINGG